MSEKIVETIRNFVDKYGLKILSDGDLDGIFGSAILLRGLGWDGDPEEVLIFPDPRKLRSLKVRHSILIELSPNKGLVYLGRNLLIDHHPEPARLYVFDGNKLLEAYSIGVSRSVASAIYRVFEDKLNFGPLALKILHSIENIDNAVYENQLDTVLHEAYFINKFEKHFRYELVRLILQDDWNEVLSWAETQAKIYEETIPKKVDMLIKKAKILLPGVVYISYKQFDKAESAAITQAMVRLEEKFDVVISLGIHDDIVEGCRIATKRNLDLTPIFEELRNLGINSGGRKNVGGAHFGMPVDKAVDILKRVISKNKEKLKS